MELALFFVVCVTLFCLALASSRFAAGPRRGRYGAYDRAQGYNPRNTRIARESRARDWRN